MKKAIAVIGILVAVAALVGWAIGYSISSNRPGNFNENVGPARVVELKSNVQVSDGKHHHYAYPQSLQNARKACFRSEREARGIPGNSGAYAAWFEASKGTALHNDWRAAYQACKDRNELPRGKWDFNAMVYLGYY